MPRPQRELDPDSLVGHFGAELRTYRNKADLSMARLATALGCSAQWIGQVELGEKPPSEEFAYDLDTYFKTCGNFHRLWEAIKRAGRCRVLLPGFPRYLELEAEAVSIRRFSTQAIPGLLQTEPYARAVMALGRLQPALDQRVAARMERQKVLLREQPPNALFVLEEAILHRPIGGSQIMCEQLETLAKFTEAGETQVRILPFASVTEAALDGAFTILSFGNDPDLVYVEAPGITQLIDDKDTVAECGVRFDLLMGEALPRAESTELIFKLLEEHR
ncbi:helix-turn-helix domain-containing protein [Actinomadura sp. HBU206391]|uniref:helix-turn-helix domain-containing protein n=1 Tax=Actinomadura sp. HBU206391 TaxID=2731692 RepID=UPI00164F0FF3|nr:helix-turn-helix transcriptional regulator [Actinomadura sp. HBU206391]MBC6459027.1 helix-turn-helix domain-containing protein [Actinomadura sp. HBU206391]